MADTTIYKTKVEPFVRGWLSERFGVPFEPREIFLSGAQPPQRQHGFDAVSLHGKIVAGINASSGKTSRGKHPAGKIHKAYQEVYFLSLIEAERKLLVLTDPDFFEIFSSETRGHLATSVEIVLCPLPPELKAEVDKVRTKATSEVGG